MDDAVDKSDNDSRLLDIEQQTELMHKDDTIWTAVFSADKIAVERIISIDPNIINARGPVGECPIHILFLYGTDAHLEIARDLIHRFPAIVTQIYNKPQYFGENILHIAIVKRNTTMVEWLLSEEFLRSYRKQLLTATATGIFFMMGQPSYSGDTPLEFACCTNQWDVVEILLKYGADMDTADSHGNNMLHLAVICNLPDIYNKFKERWIKKHGIPAIAVTNKPKAGKPLEPWNRLNKDLLTPLTLAAELRRSKMLAWLLNERKIVQWSYRDVSSVLHPLAQLDRELEEDEKNQPLCVLDLIIKNNDPNLMHPIIVCLINKKWECFVYRNLWQRFFLSFVYLLVFLASTIMEQVHPQMSEDESDEPIIIEFIHQSSIYQIVCAVLHSIVVAGALYKGGREVKEMTNIGLRNYFQSTGSVFLENCMACSFCISILLVQIFRLFDIPNHAIILAFASLVGWGYMLVFIMPLRFTGPLVIMIYKMLFNDVLRFCIIYTIFLAGFSQAFFILLNNDGIDGYLASVKNCFVGLTGGFDFELYVESPFPIATIWLIIFYIVIVAILLINLLIAMMGDTYADVKKSAKKLMNLERTRIALDVERGLGTSRRKLPVNKYWVDVQGERYLQLEVIDNTLFAATEDKADDD